MLNPAARCLILSRREARLRIYCKRTTTIALLVNARRGLLFNNILKVIIPNYFPLCSGLRPHNALLRIAVARFFFPCGGPGGRLSRICPDLSI